MSELIIPNRGTLIEGVRLPKAATEAADVAIRGMTKIVQLLPDTSKAQAFAMATLNELNKVTTTCYDWSVINAACNCAALGLIPGGALAHSHYVPKKKRRDDREAELQLWPGYRGYIHLAYQTGFLRDIYCDVVYEGEPVEVWTDDTGKHIRHDTLGRLDGDHNGKRIRCAYMVWSTTKGGRGVEVVPGGELYDLQRKQGNVWNSDFAAMCRKTPVRRGWRYWQVSGSHGERLAYAAYIDEQAERGETQDNRYLPPDVPETKRVRTLSDLTAPVALPDGPVEPVPEPVPSPAFASLMQDASKPLDQDEAGRLQEDVRAALEQGAITADAADTVRALIAANEIPY